MYTSGGKTLVVLKLKLKWLAFSQLECDIHPTLNHFRIICKWVTEYNKKLSYRRDSARCGWNSHSRSFKIIRCCANRRGNCDFLLAPNSNLSSIFNRSWDITPIVCTSIPHLSSRWNWKKTAESRWTCFGVRVPRTLDYPSIKLNPR